MKMRLAWYAAASTASAALVVVSAFHQRANFYSAMVHLAQSSLSLLVLANLVFVVYGSFMYGLQRLCFGPLRPAEIEQLYEKAWFAVTETCLAMTIFREEVGAFFLVMFTALVTGKVWGWIGEGRVEVLEQQPPANPRLFHARLSVSLLLSVIYNIWLLRYAVNTVVQQARPTMMVMFLFEFAVLNVCSFQTGFRYIVSLVEAQIIKTQTRQRLEERRRQVREEREAILERRAAEPSQETDQEELPDEDEIDEMDIEVPGWESKGLCILALDLIADLIKLGLYTAFFCVLFTFYGLPIHIIRDWFMTTRSFLKRLTAILRYRQALKDMNQYPDATPEDLGQEDTCIICREEMRPWDPADRTQVERTRAKKLPCGHILHFGCLKSWLERQQVCPTCRRPVARQGQQRDRNGDAMVFRLGLNFPAARNQGAQPANAPALDGGAAPGAVPPNNQENQNNGVRMFNFGPLRLGFAQGGANDVQELARRLGLPDHAAERIAGDALAPAPAPAPAPTPTQPAGNDAPLSIEQIRAQIAEVGQGVQQEMRALSNTAHELQVLTFLANELEHIRQQHHLPRASSQVTPGSIPPQPPPGQLPLPNFQQQPHMAHQGFPAPFPMFPQAQQPLAQAPPHSFPGFLQQPLAQAPFPMFQPPSSVFPPGPFVQQPAQTLTTLTRYGGAGYGAAIPAGSAELPEGVVIPPGWSLLPLQRLDGGAAPAEASSQNPPAFPSTAVPQGSSDQVASNGVNGSVLDSSRDTASQHTSAPIPSGSTVQPQDQPVSTSTVTAPTPMAPNWGRPTQFFGGRSSEASIFSDPRDGHQDEPADGANRSTEVAQSSASVNVEGSPPTRTVQEEGANTSSTNSAGSAGKAKAAAVEDADDSEDDSS